MANEEALVLPLVLPHWTSGNMRFLQMQVFGTLKLCVFWGSLWLLLGRSGLKTAPQNNPKGRSSTGCGMSLHVPYLRTIAILAQVHTRLGGVSEPPSSTTLRKHVGTLVSGTSSTRLQVGIALPT